MLKWERVYKRDIDNYLKLDNFVCDGVIDSRRLLSELEDCNMLCISAEGATCTLMFTDIDESDWSRARILYAVLYTICELVKFLRTEGVDIDSQRREVRYYYNILSKSYSVNGLVISADLNELRLKVRERDNAVGKVFKGSVYTADERVELHELLEMIKDARRENFVTVKRVSKVDGECYRFSDLDNMESLFSLFKKYNGTFNICLDNNFVFEFKGVDGSDELCRFDLLCELLHTIGYYLPVLTDGVKLFDSLWGRDELVSEHYRVRYFKGDYGITRKG